MSTVAQTRSDEQAFQALAMELYGELRQWREEHPEASLDEIVQQAIPSRQRLMGVWLGQVACQHGTGEVAEGLICERCGHPMVYKGRSRRAVEHLEAEIELKRAYYYCPHCDQGVFPPGPPTETDHP
jgi:hypothetical protein